MKHGFFYGLGEAIIPVKIRHHLKKYILKIGKFEVPYSFYGELFIITIISAIAIYSLMVFANLSTANPVFLILGSFVSLIIIESGLVMLAVLGLWLSYEFIIFKRTQKIEEVLPDFLEEVSVNLRAGMSFDKALWNSIQPEFGILEKEIEIVAKKVMAGGDTEEALKEFSAKYNSALLQESMDMIIIGLRYGGNIAELIDKIVENVKDAYYLKKELVASVTSYIIFIAITAVVISPILFALSFNLMQIIQGLGEKLAVTSSYSSLPFSLSYKSINPEDFVTFSKIAVVIIAFVSGMIIADLREGSIKAGIKYVLLFGPISYLIYVVMLGIFTALFGVLV